MRLSAGVGEGAVFLEFMVFFFILGLAQKRDVCFFGFVGCFFGGWFFVLLGPGKESVSCFVFLGSCWMLYGVSLIV